MPFDAELLPKPELPIPVSRTLLHDCWLGPQGDHRPRIQELPLASPAELRAARMPGLLRLAHRRRRPLLPSSRRRQHDPPPSRGTPRGGRRLRRPPSSVAPPTLDARPGRPVLSDGLAAPIAGNASPAVPQSDLDLRLQNLDRVANRLAVGLQLQGPAERSQGLEGLVELELALGQPETAPMW